MKANKYKKMRQELGLTQLQLAKKLKITQPTVCNWERNICHPYEKTMAKLNKLMSK